MTAKSIALTDIQAAQTIIAGRVLRTPMLPAPRLSEATGADIFVKYENLQVTNSFKERGALNKLLHSTAASAARRDRDVGGQSRAGRRVSCQAARHRRDHRHAGDDAVRKVAATKAHGADVVLHGESVGEAQERAETLARSAASSCVHPYDDARIIAGQGTIALEMLEDVPDLDCLVIPIGGGGLISGNAIAAKAINPAIEIFGVEAALYPSMWNAAQRRGKIRWRADAGGRHRGQESSAR